MKILSGSVFIVSLCASLFHIAWSLYIIADYKFNENHSCFIICVEMVPYWILISFIGWCISCAAVFWGKFLFIRKKLWAKIPFFSIPAVCLLMWLFGFYDDYARKMADEPRGPRPDTRWYADAISVNPDTAFFTISTAEGLAGLAAIVNGEWGGTPHIDDFSGKTVVLDRSINLSSYKNWRPIGAFLRDDTCQVFSGTFDGGSHTVKNLTINRKGNGHRRGKDYQGLFGAISNGTIKNLGLENVNIAGDDYIGAAAGLIGAGSALSNCYSTGKISGVKMVGGLAGHLFWGSAISNSYSAAAVSARETNEFLGAITSGTGNNSAGGVVGRVSVYSRVVNSYSTGAVWGAANVIGGIAGDVSDSSAVINCAALNPAIGGRWDLWRVVGAINADGKAAASTVLNNAVYAGMKVDADSAWHRCEHCIDPGYNSTEITAEEIRVDGTIGGRFRAEDGWTVENGRLPGLFGKTVEIPEYLRR